MKNKALYKKEVFTDSSALSEIVTGFNSMFAEKRLKRDVLWNLNGNSVELTHKRTLLEGIEIFQGFIKSSENIRITSHALGNYYVIYISTCFDNEWSEKLSRSEWTLPVGEGAMIKVREAIESNTLRAGIPHSGFSLYIGADRLKNFMPDGFSFYDALSTGANNYCGRKFYMTENIKRVISDINACPLTSDVRFLYMEAKALELLSSVMEQVLEKPADERPSLARTDVGCVMQIKDMIDSDPTNAFTLKELSIMFGINEFRLKRDFKEVCGMPVYSYILEKRMNIAAELLTKGHSVADAASRVGYSEPSSFSRAFKRKFGFSPGSCNGSKPEEDRSAYKPV